MKITQISLVSQTAIEIYKIRDRNQKDRKF